MNMEMNIANTTGFPLGTLSQAGNLYPWLLGKWSFKMKSIIFLHSTKSNLNQFFLC